MTLQPNEQVYYDADGIFISQFRFVTPDGSVYPTNTMQRVWGSVDRANDGSLSRPMTCLLLLLMGPLLILFLWLRRSRRNAPMTRYWANFTFAGGGTFTGTSTGWVSTASDSIGGFANLRTRSERQADFAVWSHDEDWTRNLIAAANEAMVAARA